jgi:hypothetical protein
MSGREKNITLKAFLSVFYKRRLSAELAIKTATASG